MNKSKNIFRFKQFEIWQDLTAMKVGTDGVLLGAWANMPKAKTVLDIGTGTGLVAIMLAQKKTSAQITAVEINEQAFRQAKQNAENCKWADRIEVVSEDFLIFSETTNSKFDLIVCNPPFFSNSLKSNNLSKQQARHSDFLPFDKLIVSVAKIISENGIFCVILPASEEKYFVKICSERGLNLQKITYIKPNHTKPPKRILMQFGKKNVEIIKNILTIETEKRHCYTDDYKQLTKDFYLNF